MGIFKNCLICYGSNAVPASQPIVLQYVWRKICCSYAAGLTAAAVCGDDDDDDDGDDTGSESDDVRAGTIQSVRVVQPTPLQPRQRSARKHLHAVERLLVRGRDADAAGVRHQPARRVNSHRRRHVVVLHAYYYLVVHCQPCRFPHC